MAKQEYEIAEADVKIIKAQRISESKENMIEYSLRQNDKGWVIYYDHFNVDTGPSENRQIFLPNEIVDIMISHHAKKKLENEQ